MFRSLINREIIGSNRATQTLLKKIFKKNLLSNNSHCVEVACDTFDFDTAHNGDYLAALTTFNQLALFKISFAMQVWHCNYREYMDDNFREVRNLVVSDTGLVLLVAKERDRWGDSCQVVIFSEGRHTGNFITDLASVDFDSLRIINNRIFGISNFAYCKRYQFYEWDIHGKLLSSVSMANLVGSYDPLFTAYKNLIIFSAKAKETKKYSLFLFDLNKNCSHVLTLNQPEFSVDKLHLDSILLIEKFLVISSHSDVIDSNPTVTLIDLPSWETIRQFSINPPQGHLYILTGNTRFIIIGKVADRTIEEVYCINLNKNGMDKVIQKDRSAIIESLHLDDSLLIVFFCIGHGLYATMERCVMDLNQDKIKKTIRTKHNYSPSNRPRFFASDTLIISLPNKLRFEQFNHLNGLKKPGEESAAVVESTTAAAFS